ncbi:MAG: hypothetical protein SX243_13100 [Acidobacteriota bacterium]|nr:hypothetical protein [Acidobacteriota bacterium]
MKHHKSSSLSAVIVQLEKMAAEPSLSQSRRDALERAIEELREQDKNTVVDFTVIVRAVEAVSKIFVSVSRVWPW